MANQHLSLIHQHQASISGLFEDFVIELPPQLLLELMTHYGLKASDISGPYSVTLHEGISSVAELSTAIQNWPKLLSWPQFNHKINQLLLSWLADYESGVALDEALLLAGIIKLESEAQVKFHQLLLHLFARVTNQLDQYKFNYIQHFDLETGLPNQHLLLSFLDQRIKQYEAKQHLGLVLVNLNVSSDEISQSHNVNASNLVSAAAQTIQQQLGDDVTLFRVGVYELGILIEHINFTAQLNLIASKLVHAFESALPLENATLILAPYFGCISSFNTRPEASSIYECAMLALHHAMNKNYRIKIYDQHTTSSFMNMHLLDEAIIEALQQNELDTFFQPIITLPAETCSSAEVLLRWPSQEWQSISPARLIDTIYNKGFGKLFIRWLINTVCQRIAELIAAHKRDILLTINLSVTDLLDPDLPDLLTQSIALWDIKPSNLVIEITESDILVDEEKVSQVIDKIVLLGCKLALDDFGTGYSSMARLRNMPIHLVKIDQSFVRNIAHSNEDKEIVQSVVKLAHSLGKQVVAEGVENDECLNILKSMKCEKIQGYHYAKPMSFDEFNTWLSVFDAQETTLTS